MATIKVYLNNGVPTLVPNPTANLLPTEVNYPQMGAYWSGDYVQFRNNVDRGFTFGGKKFYWGDVQDVNGNAAGASLQDVKDYLSTIFFLNNGTSTLDTSLVFDNTKTDMAKFGIDSFSNITVIQTGNNREAVFFNQDVYSVEFTKIAQGFGGANWIGVGGVAALFTAITIDYTAASGGASVTDMTPPTFAPISPYAPLLNFSTYTRFKIWRNDAVSPVQYTLFGYNGSIFVPIYAVFDKNTVPFSGYTGIQSNSQLALSKDTGAALGLTGLDIYLNGGNSTALNQGVSMLDVALGTPLP